MFKSLESGKQLPSLGSYIHNKNLLEKIFRDEASMVLKESMYTVHTAQCIAKKGREGIGGLLMGRKMGN